LVGEVGAGVWLLDRTPNLFWATTMGEISDLRNEAPAG